MPSRLRLLIGVWGSDEGGELVRDSGKILFRRPRELVDVLVCLEGPWLWSGVVVVLGESAAHRDYSVSHPGLYAITAAKGSDSIGSPALKDFGLAWGVAFEYFEGESDSEPLRTTRMAAPFGLSLSLQDLVEDDDVDDEDLGTTAAMMFSSVDEDFRDTGAARTVKRLAVCLLESEPVVMSDSDSDEHQPTGPAAPTGPAHEHGAALPKRAELMAFCADTTVVGLHDLPKDETRKEVAGKLQNEGSLHFVQKDAGSFIDTLPFSHRCIHQSSKGLPPLDDRRQGRVKPTPFTVEAARYKDHVPPLRASGSQRSQHSIGRWKTFPRTADIVVYVRSTIERALTAVLQEGARDARDIEGAVRLAALGLPIERAGEAAAGEGGPRDGAYAILLKGREAMTRRAVNLQPGVPLRLPEGGRFSLRNASLTGDHDSGYTELVLSISNADDGPPDHGVVCVLAPSFAVQQTLSLDLSPPQTYILEARGPNTISIIGLGSSNPRSLSTADHGQRSQDSDIFPPVQSNHDGDDAAEVSPAPPEEEVPGEPTSHALRCPDLLNDGAADEEATIVLQNLEVTILYAVQDWSGRWLLDRSDQPTTIRVGENHWMPVIRISQQKLRTTFWGDMKAKGFMSISCWKNAPLL
ncbi:hypothetical protein FB107DRAFT_252661 [Schizophyllum commune]